MATSYYICKKNAKTEYDEIKKYWEDEFVDKVRDLLIKKCEEIDGEFVNRDYATEKLLEDSSVLSNYFPDFDIPTESQIGQFSSVKQCFDYDLCPGEIRIRSKRELEIFLKDNPDYFIYSETGEEYSLKQFFRKTKQL